MGDGPQADDPSEVLIVDDDADESLRKLGYRIAVDDLGAGYVGLASFSQLEPDIAKLDMSLVRGISPAPQAAAPSM